MEQYLTSYDNGYGQAEFDLNSLYPSAKKSLVKAIIDLSTDDQLVHYMTDGWSVDDLKAYLDTPVESPMPDAVLAPYIKALDLHTVLIDDAVIQRLTKLVLPL